MARDREKTRLWNLREIRCRKVGNAILSSLASNDQGAMKEKEAPSNLVVIVEAV